MKSKFTFVLLLFALQLYAQTDGNVTRSYQAELKVLSRKFSSSFYPNYAQTYRLPEKAFIARIDSARAEFNLVLSRFENTLDAGYTENQKAEIKYYFDKLLIEYPLTHEIYGNGESALLSKIPERLSKNLKDFNRPELLANTDFVDYFKAYMALKVNLELRKGTYKKLDNQHFLATWKLIPKYVSNIKCKEYWQFYYLFNQIDNDGTKHLNAVYKKFITTCKDTAYLNKINKLYNEDITGKQGHKIQTYKSVGPFKLDIHLFEPEKSKFTGNRPTIVYFHGGSWSEGKPDWFFSTCQSYAQKGWVACAVEYRTYGRHGTLPFEAVKDAKSAIRWLRQHADKYGIDTGKIIASGNSAGGHLALATALANNWNEITDDLSISAKPDALIINAGVYDLNDDITAWISKDLTDKNLTKEISPNFLITNNFPPAVIFHGTNDRNVPFASAQKFVNEMRKAGNTNIDFYPLQGAGHFIWFDPKQSETMSKARNEFLKKWGY